MPTGREKKFLHEENTTLESAEMQKNVVGDEQRDEIVCLTDDG